MAKCLKDGCKNAPGLNQFCQHHRPDSDFPECSICHESIRRYKETLDCNHCFHRRCIDRWAERSDSCPICRRAMFNDVGTQTHADWGYVLHDSIQRAMNDMNNGATNVNINITFSSA